jgi:hypothetical protein
VPDVIDLDVIQDPESARYRDVDLARQPCRQAAGEL